MNEAPAPSWLPNPPQPPTSTITAIEARHVPEDKSYQTRPKIDAGDASLLMGSIRKTRLEAARDC